jgi:hypothetical protein
VCLGKLALIVDLGRHHTQLQALDAQIAEARREQKLLVEREAVIAKLEGRLTNLERDVTAQINQSAPQFAELGLDVSQIITLTINRESLTARKAATVAVKAKIDASLSADNPEGQLAKRGVITDNISALRSQLDAPDLVVTSSNSTLAKALMVLSAARKPASNGWRNYLKT